MRAVRRGKFSRSHLRAGKPSMLNGFELLENRSMMTVSVNNIQLLSDTGVSASDKITTTAVVTGTTTGTLPWGATAHVQFDHNGDGTVDGSVTPLLGLFSYNPLATDSALQNWEAALNLRYRVKEVDGYGGVISQGDWQNFNMTLDRKAPTSTGLADVVVAQENPDTPSTQVNLNNAFADGVTADSALRYQVVSNSNPLMFSSLTVSGGVLTVDYAPGWYGMADLVVRATDQAGNSKDTSLFVDVAHTPIAPIILEFSITSLGGNQYQLTGNVIDDGDMTGFCVIIIVLEVEDYLFAEIQADGSFSAIYECANPGEFALAIAVDGEDQVSEEVWASFV